MATRVRTATVLVSFLLSSAFASAEELKGIELSDMDRSADACTDFFEFSNGAWRAANPIPPSMSRWSRRWQAGEESKERLKGILEETATKSDKAGAPKGSVDQLVGDYYAASASAESFRRHLDQWVFGVRDHAEFLERVGVDRLLTISTRGGVL